jgi:hypothetical protein
MYITTWIKDVLARVAGHGTTWAANNMGSEQHGQRTTWAANIMALLCGNGFSGPTEEWSGGVIGMLDGIRIIRIRLLP